MAKQQSELVKIIEANQIEESQAQTILDNFTGFFEEAKKWEAEAKAIVVTSVMQVEEVKKARDLRLKLKKIRTEAENNRKRLKEGIVREGKAIDGIANVLKALVVPLEEHLQAQEDFAARKQAEIEKVLRVERLAALKEYELDFISQDLGPMSETDFQAILAGAKALKEKADAEKKILEEARIAKEKEEAAEKEKLRLENERLRKEAEAKELELKKEREEAQKAADITRKELDAVREEAAKAAQIEREAREKAEAELRAKQQAEEAEKAAAEEAKSKAMLYPDREKLELWGKTVNRIEEPTFEHGEAKYAYDKSRKAIVAMLQELRKDINNLK